MYIRKRGEGGGREEGEGRRKDVKNQTVKGIGRAVNHALTLVRREQSLLDCPLQKHGVEEREEKGGINKTLEKVGNRKE